ncbi:MAG: efflux RND transporter permease subunit [Persicimonas sp.]
MKDLASFSVRRPAVALVMAIMIVLFGVLAYFQLGVREFPAADPAVVSVSTQYAGADADVIESQITEPLESELNSIEGIAELDSTSRRNQSSISIEFDRDVDLDRAANDVRDRASRARNQLPPDADPPVVEKADAEGRPVIWIRVESETRDVLDVTEIAETRMKERLETVPGVSSVQLWGSQTYAMRLWMNPTLMASHGVTAHDVARAIDEQNLEIPSGRVDGDTVELAVKAPSRLYTPEDFEQLVLRRDGDTLIKFEDIGYAEYGAIERRELMRGDGEPAMMTVLSPRAGANQIEIVDEARDRMKTIEDDLPDGVTAEVVFDGTEYIRQSIDEVQMTIFLALAIVISVIFLFLGDWRTTLIPVLVIPVAIVGAFTVMALAGFSINVLTMLALVLAMGIVVDDAIVVIENVYAKIEEGMSPRLAAVVGTREVFFAIVATTLALVVVFLPILFMGGLTGELFTEFGVVMAGTVILSSFAALTIAPMLCAKILKKRDEKPLFQRITDPFYDALGKLYAGELAAFMKVRWVAFLIIAAAGAGGYFLVKELPSELAPKEDRGEVRVQAQAPQGTNFEYMDDFMKRSISLIQEEVPERDLLNSMTSPTHGPTGSVNSGFHFLTLEDREDRERTQTEIANDLNKELRKLTGGTAVVNEPATIADDFRGLPVQFVIQNLNNERIREVLPEFLSEARDRPELTNVDVDLKFNQPDLDVRVDRERAAALNVPVRRINETLDLSLSSLRFGYFLRNAKQYDVIGQVARENRATPQDLRELYVRSDDGELISLADLVTTDEDAGPPLRFRYNRYNAATVQAKPAEGYTVGDGVEAMEEIADEHLDETFTTDLKGQTKEYDESSADLYLAFGLAILLVYLVLSAQFESFRDALTILLTVPLALLGALAGLWFFDQTLNVFSQIGMIMLIGLVSKNGILIVEFANQRRAEGVSVREAAREAARVRFRPVLMTSISTILGILPIALALGAGAESRVPMGIAFIGGMAVGSFFTLFVVPAVYTFIASDEMDPAQREAAKVEAEIPEGFEDEVDESPPHRSPDGED